MPSPLEEADPHSLDLLFSRLKSNQIKNMPWEIKPIPFEKRVKDLRKQRLKFTQDYEAFLKAKLEAKIKRIPGPNSNSKAAIISRTRDLELDF